MSTPGSWMTVEQGASFLSLPVVTSAGLGTEHTRDAGRRNDLAHRWHYRAQARKALARVARSRMAYAYGSKVARSRPLSD
jgi:hypothetical protein